MPIPLPDLDDRRFTDLMSELRALIPRYAPDWTDHNPTDPGITLLELLAWVTESLLYRTDRAHRASEVRFLELLGARFEAARPAAVHLSVSATGLTRPLVIECGATLTATAPGRGEPTGLETAERLTLTASEGEPGVYRGTVEALQVVRVTDEPLGSGTGEPFQRRRLTRRFVMVPEETHTPVGRVPQDIARGLPEAGPEPSRPAPQGLAGTVHLHVRSAPRPPVVTVDGVPWSFRPSLLRSGPDALHFTVDTHLDAVCFGNGDSRQGMGLAPAKGARITASYHHTLGARGEIASTDTFAFTTDYGVPLEITATALRPGRDPTGIPQARAQARTALRRPFRAITARDFEQIVLSAPRLGLARARCLPGVDLSAGGSGQTGAEDHVSIVVVPASHDPRPTPSQEQLGRVHEFLDERRLITCRHHVLGPGYTWLRCEATVYAIPQEPTGGLRRRIERRLVALFDPISGGPDGKGGGWPFGRSVYASEVYQLLEETEGVDHVRRLVLHARDPEGRWGPAQRDELEVPARNLVYLDIAQSRIEIRPGRG